MPELPDLEYLVKHLRPGLVGRRILSVSIHEPIVLRVLLPGAFAELLVGDEFETVERHGPFLRFGLRLAAGQSPALGFEQAPTQGEKRYDLVMHLMLAGRLRLARSNEKRLAHEAFSLALDDGSSLAYGDEKCMGKVYLCEAGRFESIPGYLSQGLDVRGPDFDYAAFSRLIAKKRCQVRVFIMDQSALSAIGNAYADEVLFEAGLHPKTLCSSLAEADKKKLFDSIVKVLAWGIEEVERAGKPLEEKVRGHMRVRNRAGQACPICGTTIRKAGVLGFDSFFCPRCQKDRSGRGLDWNKLPPANENQKGES